MHASVCVVCVVRLVLIFIEPCVLCLVFSLKVSSLKKTVTALAEKQPESNDALKCQAKKPKLSKELSVCSAD